MLGNKLLSFHFLLINVLYDHLCNQPRGPLHNVSTLCIGWRVIAYIMGRNLHFLGHGPCPCLHLSENLNPCPLGAYPRPWRRARVKVSREWGDGPQMHLFHVSKWLLWGQQTQAALGWAREGSPLSPTPPRRCPCWRGKKDAFTRRKEVKGLPDGEALAWHLLLRIALCECGESAQRKRWEGFPAGMKSALWSWTPWGCRICLQSLFLALPWLLWHPYPIIRLVLCVPP